MPSSSRERSRSDSVRGEMPSSDRSSSQKRARPSARSRITNSVHLPQTMSAVRQTGQSEFGIALQSIATLQKVKLGERDVDPALLRPAHDRERERLLRRLE